MYIPDGVKRYEGLWKGDKQHGSGIFVRYQRKIKIKEENCNTGQFPDKSGND
ncbi:MAG: hypothetical protein IPL35_12660 [Sphingobacteriales bacterium]|nr:hypothetical protein [Sphingobacteriales bacterium]